MSHPERTAARVSARAGAAVAALVAVVACGGEGEIEQPTPLFGEVPIEYPLHMWDQDMEGETLLRVRVSDVGAVDSVEVLHSSGYASFDSAAVAGARNLRFTPARRDGERIVVWAEVPVYFSKRPRPDTLGVSNGAGA
ncbi:MAG TPA: energy transducer TonB [Longimicrobiales bacterium]|nr:energy transducer TonB [Longimicrobiales bacterium]